MATAGLADVGAGDLQPLVPGGVVEHPLQQLAVARLELGLIAQTAARLADAPGERVAHGLQVAEPERPRLGRDGGYAGVELETGEGLGHQGAELRFEPADLATQLDPSEPLVAIDANRRASL